MDRLLSSTKNILEIMDEMQVKIAPLEDDYKEKVNAYEALQSNIYSLKDSFCNKQINLETHEKMRLIITAKLKRIIKLAESVYSLCQEASNEMKHRKSETKANSEMKTNNLSNYKNKQAEILGKVKALNKKQEQFNKRTISEKKLISEECTGNIHLLKKELDNVLKELERYKINNIEKECVLNKRELAEKNENFKISEELEIIENEFFTISKTTEDIESNYYKLSGEVDSLSKGIEDQYLLNHNKIEVKSNEIQCISTDVQNIHDQIKSLEENTKTTNAEMQQYLEETDHVNADIRINERNENRVAIYKDDICKKELILSQLDKHKSGILEELMSSKVETEILIRENSEITDYLDQNKELQIEDLMEQIYNTESDIQDIKLSLRKIKNDHEIKTHELNIRLKEFENENVKLDSNMKQRQEAMSNLENEIKQNKEKNTSLNELIKKHNDLLDSLERKRKQMQAKICEKEVHKLKANNIPKKKPRMEPLPKRNPWDSDSSLEGIDTSFAERVARNMEVKLQKKKPK